MALSTVCPVRAARRHPRGRWRPTSCARPMTPRRSSSSSSSRRPGDRRRPVRADRRADDPPQRQPQPAPEHEGRRRRAAHPQAPRGLVLPGPARAAPADRPGPLGGRHGGLRPWRLAPARSTTSCRPGHRRRVSARARSAGSAASSTRSWPRFRERPLDHIRFPYVFLDATYVKAHDGASVVSKAIVIATGVTADGRPRGPGPRGRRLRGRRLLDGLPAQPAGARASAASGSSSATPTRASRAAIAAVLLGCGLAALPGPLPAQRPGPHPEGQRRDGARRHPDDLRPARRGARCASSSTRSSSGSTPRFPVAAAMLAEARDDVHRVHGLPDRHWKKIWSTNPLERVNKEIKRRTDVVGHLPQRGGRPAARRGGPARDPRRVGDRRAALPLRGLHGPA